MEATRNSPSIRQNSVLPAAALRNKAGNKYITDFFEKRAFPAVSRARERVRQIKEIVSIAVGKTRCRKFVFA